MIEVNKLNQSNKFDYIKDLVVLESLGISEDNTYLESDIESSIITHTLVTLSNLNTIYL